MSFSKAGKIGFYENWWKELVNPSLHRTQLTVVHETCVFKENATKSVFLLLNIFKGSFGKACMLTHGQICLCYWQCCRILNLKSQYLAPETFNFSGVKSEWCRGAMRCVWRCTGPCLVHRGHYHKYHYCQRAWDQYQWNILLPLLQQLPWLTTPLS